MKCTLGRHGMIGEWRLWEVEEFVEEGIGGSGRRGSGWIGAECGSE